MNRTQWSVPSSTAASARSDSLPSAHAEEEPREVSTNTSTFAAARASSSTPIPADTAAKGQLHHSLQAQHAASSGSAANVFRFEQHFPDAVDVTQTTSMIRRSGAVETAASPPLATVPVVEGCRSTPPPPQQVGPAKPTSSSTTTVVVTPPPGTPPRSSGGDLRMSLRNSSPSRQRIDIDDLSSVDEGVKVPFRTGDAVFDLPDVRVRTDQFDALHRAALDVRTIHEDLTTAVNALTNAARKQHLDTANLTQQHQRLCARVDTVWRVASEAREEASQNTEGLRQHVQSFNSVVDLLMRRTAEQERELNVLRRFAYRNARLAQQEASRNLERTAGSSTLGKYYGRWVKWTLRNRLTDKLFLENYRVICGRFYLKWLSMARLRSGSRAARSLLSKTLTAVLRRSFSKWTAFLRVRCIVHRKVNAIAHSAAKQLLRTRLHAWRRYLLLKAQHYRRTRVAGSLLCSTHKMLLTRRYAQWVRLVYCRRKRLRSIRLSRLLERHSHQAFLFRVFQIWLRLRNQNYRKRHGLVQLHERSLLQVLRLYFSKWRKLQSERWIIQQIDHRLNPVDYKVEIGLRTATNTSDTIQQLLRHFATLEDRVSVMSAEQRKIATAVQLEQQSQESFTAASFAAVPTTSKRPGGRGGVKSPTRSKALSAKSAGDGSETAAVTHSVTTTDVADHQRGSKAVAGTPGKFSAVVPSPSLAGSVPRPLHEFDCQHTLSLEGTAAKIDEDDAPQHTKKQTPQYSSRIPSPKRPTGSSTATEQAGSSPAVPTVAIAPQEASRPLHYQLRSSSRAGPQQSAGTPSTGVVVPAAAGYVSIRDRLKVIEQEAVRASHQSSEHQ